MKKNRPGFPIWAVGKIQRLPADFWYGLLFSLLFIVGCIAIGLKNGWS